MSQPLQFLDNLVVLVLSETKVPWVGHYMERHLNLLSLQVTTG
jgi:hypothetical protein